MPLHDYCVLFLMFYYYCRKDIKILIQSDALLLVKLLTLHCIYARVSPHRISPFKIPKPAMTIAVTSSEGITPSIGILLL